MKNFPIKKSAYTSGGRGSGVKYIHNETSRILQFDQPHPGNELYKYQMEMVKEFLKNIRRYSYGTVIRI